MASFNKEFNVKNGLAVNGTVVINSNGLISTDRIDGVLLPDQTGHVGQFLKTDGSIASWETVDLTTVDAITLDGHDSTYFEPANINIQAHISNTSNPHSVTYLQVGAASSSHDHSGTYEPVISSGTTAQFWRGDKTWQAVPLPSGLTSGSTSTGFLQYAGTTSTAGQLDGGATAPLDTTRLNYNGYFYATKVYNAVYNDYAEYFEKGDSTLEAGDVVSIDENTNTYIKSQGEFDTKVVGVYSDDYAHCIGGLGDENDEENFVSVGMSGRVRVKATGEIKKGDLLVSSNINGVAKVGNRQGCIIGKALENHSGNNIDRIKMLILNG